ncbi:MAG: glycosyltransferase [Candidatus Bathyarchaeota archaeon]|nr:glycosyltransferase [Candidatus Bathyarchaeota archaeon]
MIYLLAAWLAVGALFLGVPAAYFVYMKKRSVGAWNLTVEKDYLPSVAILIPVHNEESVIRLKLDNISRLKYPAEKMDIFVANDCSTDGTMAEVNRYTALHPELKISVFDSKIHLGKTGCLNTVLKSIRSDVVVISDVDCFWPSDILTKAMPYLSDPTVGAVTAREMLLNSGDSWVTHGEQFYDRNIQAVRIGESKLHSTIIFQGGFAAYKRSVLEEFNHATDDSGTALDIVQNNKRTLLIPEIGFFTVSPTTWKSKIAIKIRRASHLQHLWARCLNLLVHRKLGMPNRIAVPEILLHIFNPLLLVALAVLTVAVAVVYPLLGLALAAAVLAVFAVKKTRTSALELLQNNLILLWALSSFFVNRKFTFWKPVAESRSALSEAVLREKNLI